MAACGIWGEITTGNTFNGIKVSMLKAVREERDFTITGDFDHADAVKQNVLYVKQQIEYVVSKFTNHMYIKCKQAWMRSMYMKRHLRNIF